MWLDEIAPCQALDAACGTGRHARHLVEGGHRVTCIDQTAALLARARRNVPAAEFHRGDLCYLPLEDFSYDLAVCALALEHVGDLKRAVAELARVVRPDGRVVISESHPTLRALGGAPYFVDAAGASGVVRSHRHAHANYLDAFAAARLALRACKEIPFGREQVAMQPTASLFPEATEAAFLGFPALRIWDLTVG